jgi:uncharacterized membrane protein
MDAKSKIKSAKPSPYLPTFIFLLITFAISLSYGFFNSNFNMTTVIRAGRIIHVIKYPLLGVLVYIIVTIIISLLAIGYLWFAIKISRSQPTVTSDIFSSFYMPLKVIGLSFMIGIFVMLWSLLLIIPGIVAAYRYRMAFFILYDNPDIGIMQCISQSKEMMKGHKAELFVLDLSFFGWALLGVLTLYILYIWLLPYIVVTQINFYDALCRNNTSPGYGQQGSAY